MKTKNIVLNTFTKRTFIFFLAFITIATKIYYWFFIFPNPDEAYYWLWGQHPDLSYHDHPALQALIQNIFTSFFGTSLFILRLPVFLSSICISYILILIIKKLNYKTSYLYLILFFSSPLFYLFTSFAWNDYILITNCFISGYFYMNFIHEIWVNEKGTTKNIFLGSLFLGLAIISKYNAIFLGLGIISLLIFTKKLHCIFKDYRLYLSLLIILMVSSPILIWNAKNKFGSFEFNIQQRTIDPFINYEFFKGNYIGFILGSLVMLSPFIWWGIIELFKKKKNNEINSYIIVYTKFSKHIFLVSTITFLFLSIFSNVLYYWNIVGLLFITPLAINFLINNKKEISSLIFSSILIIAITIHFGGVPLTLIFGGKDEDSIYHYGWHKIKSKVLKHQENNKIPILTSSYRNASLLAFSMNNPKIYSYSSRFDQFNYWTKNISYKTNSKGLILTDDRSLLNNELISLFSEIKSIDTITITKYNYNIKCYYLYKGIFK